MLKIIHFFLTKTTSGILLSNYFLYLLDVGFKKKLKKRVGEKEQPSPNISSLKTVSKYMDKIIHKFKRHIKWWLRLWISLWNSGSLKDEVLMELIYCTTRMYNKHLQHCDLAPDTSQFPENQNNKGYGEIFKKCHLHLYLSFNVWPLFFMPSLSAFPLFVVLKCRMQCHMT